MLIFYNWGGGLWHFTEFRGGILISKEFRNIIRPRFPPSPSPPTPNPPPTVLPSPSPFGPLPPLPLPLLLPPPHIISVNFLLNTTFHQLFTETHIYLRCTSTCIYHKWCMRGEV